MQVLEALDGDVVAAGLHGAPVGGGAGDHLDVGGEGFDDDLLLVADLLEGGDDGLPVERVVARGAAVRAAGVEVAEVLAGLEDGGGLVLLLDVHVERVEVELHVREVDGLDEAEALVAGVEEVGLEAVQRLDVELDALLLGVLAEDLEVLDDELEVLGLGLVVMGADEADDGIERADDCLLYTSDAADE